MVLVLLSQQAGAQTLSVPGYEIHYSVFPSAFLTAEVASHYGIVRSSARSLLNVSVRRPSIRAMWNLRLFYD